MTAQDMVDILALRLEDPDKKQFTDSFKLSALDDAQILVATLSNTDFLTEIQHIDASESVSSSKVLLTALAYDVLNGIMGIINIRNSANGYYAHRLGLKDLKKMENSFMVSSATNPMYFPFAKAIYPYPTTIAALDVHYIKIPNPLRHAFTMVADDPASTTTFIGDASQGLSLLADAYNGAVIYNIATGNYHVVTDYTVTTRTFTVSPVRSGATTWSSADTFYFVTGDYELINLSAVTCELNSALHETVVAFAEVECWKSVNKLDRASTALASAIGMLQDINGQYIAPE
jgi:hypothetical protein